MSQSEMPLDAALDLVRGWTEGLAALPPPTEEDFQGFSGATDSPMRTYLAVLRSVDSPREVPIEQHFAAVSYLREHSRTQLPRELWEKAFESIRSAWERKMGIDPRMQEAAKRGVARAKTEAEELRKKKVETYQKKVKEYEEKKAAHEASVVAKTDYEKRLKAGETGAEEAPPVVPPKPRKPRVPKEEGGVETERAVGKATDEELFAREFLTGDMSDVRPNGVNSGSVRGGSWVWLPEQGVLQVKTGLSPGHRLKTAHLAEAGVKGFLDVAADFTWNIPADSILGFADLLDAGWPVVAKALRMFSPKWKAPEVGAPGAGGQAPVERKAFSGDAREGRSLSGNPWQWAWSPQNPNKIKLLVPYNDIQNFPVRGERAFESTPNGKTLYWWSYNISDLDAIISYAVALSPGFVKAAEAFQSTWNPEAPPVDTSGVEITPIGVTPEQKEAEKKATYRGTAAKGTAFGRENWQWSWNKADPDTLLLQFPVRGATKQELGINAAKKIPVTSRSILEGGAYWRAYPLDQLDEILKAADDYCEGLRDAAGAFSATWLTREAVSEQALLRARFLVRKFKHMLHHDVRADETKLEGILAKVAPLLERIVLGTLKADLGPHGAFEVLFNDSEPNQSKLGIKLPFEKSRALQDSVRGGQFRNGAVWFSIRKTPDVARALDLISPPLAIALRLAWLIDPDLFQRGDRNCGPLQEIAGAIRLEDIVDPAVRAQATAIYERTRKFLTIDPYDYQKVGIAYLELSNWRALVGDAMGLGKAEPVSSLVLTPSGWRRIGDLRVGDRVIDPDGGTAFVTGVYPQGVKPIFRVTTCDGASAECCDEHLWLVQTATQRHRGHPGVVLPLKEFRGKLHNTTLRKGVSEKNRKYFLPVTEPVEFDPQLKPLPLDPYVLGALIANGSFGSHTPTLSTGHSFVAREVENRLPSGVSLRPLGDGPDYTISTSSFGVSRALNCNPVKAALRELGLDESLSVTKFIPELYLRASIEDRKALLMGLMDGDGDCSISGKSCVVSYNTSSQRLRDDVRELICSLGGFASVYEKIPTYTHSGEKRIGNTSWRLHIRLPFNPFLLPEKARRWRPSTLARGIESVDAAGESECVCISVSSRRRLYITDGYLVTHNTLQGLSALAANREILTPALVVCPLSVKLNWVKEAEKFTPGLRGRAFETEKRVVLKRKDGNVEKTIPATDLSALKPGDFVTTTWNSVDDNFNTFKDAGFKCIIFDESHWLKSTKSARYKASKALAEGIPHVIELSGTAMEAKPEDLWPQLNIIDPVVFSNFYEFKNRYGDGNKRTVGKITFQDDWGLEKKDAPEEEEEEDETPDDEDGGGTSRRRKKRGVTARQLAVLGELREDLRCFMVRRMKHELGNQIPEKTRQLLWNDLPPDLRKAYDLVKNNLVEWVVKAKETALTRAAVTWLKHEKNVEPLGVRPLPRFPSVEAWREWLREPGAHEAIEAATKAILEELGDYDPTKQMQLKAVGYLRRILGVAKARIAAEIIPEFLEETGGTEQIIVVIEHKKPFEILKAALDKHKIAWTFIVGGVPLEKRQQRAEDFLKKKYQVIILSRAATEGINLFSASNVLFVERMWVPSKEEQLEDRAHRTGQKSNVNVRYLMANDTFDERIAEIVDNKRALTEAVLRGEGTKGILKYGGAEKQKLSLKGLLDLKLGREKTVSLTPEMVTDAIRKGGDPKEEAPKFEEDSTDSELEGSDMDMEEESGRSGPLPPETTGSGPSFREFSAWVGARTDVFSERYGVPAETLQSWITPERMAQIDPKLNK